VTMSTRAKQRIFVAVLALLVVWPLVHFGLSRRYHINHWRFTGFAMYTRPPYVVRLQFSGRLPDGPLSPARLRDALGADASRVDGFVSERKLWGTLATPQSLGRLIQARLPDLRDLVITVVTIGLEGGDDYLSYSIDRYPIRTPYR